MSGSRVQTQAETYLRLLGYLRPYWGRFGLAVLCTFVVGSLGAAPALLVKYAVDDVLIARDMGMAFLISAAVVAVFGIRAVVAYGQSYFMYWVGQRVVMDLRNELHRHLVRLPMRFFEGKTTGELMAKSLYDISLMQKAATSSIRDLGRDFFTFIALLCVAVYQNPKMTLIFLAVFPPVGFLIARMGEKVRRITRRSQERIGILSALMKETYAGIRVVKAFGAEGYEGERFARANLSFFRQVMGAMRVRALAPSLVEGIGGVLAGVILWLGALMVMRGEVTAGELSSFLVAIGMVYSPLKSLTRVYHTLMEGLAGSQAVFELIDAQGPEETNPDGRKMGRLSQGIRFEGVSFAYETAPVLRDIRLDIPAGKVLAVVGLSGAGKTTLLDLIPRFYVPASGRILYDGADGAELDLQSLRAQIAVVGQHVTLFNDTVSANIAYAVEGPVDPKAVEAAARAANAHGFISALPQGYGTVLGEEGVRLSGGERQRIAIARAILRDPSILLLDEATSSLDSESEKIIQEALERLTRGRTTVVVAHRLSTVRAADAIAVLDDGQLVDFGTHEMLMARGGLYRKLHEMQFAPGAPEDLRPEEPLPLLRGPGGAA
ncbi:MAG: ATP-binding cassette domain-containing protein [Candidatus Tectomicrobia bacterium]|uniref:ATP-binding cassette domain-containing protein n=1 Tax=Tectimicrobiota bacterium TaxID=2528274 RepID=A0A932HXY6_UNCTE|nr:ATP-binding cassette domain-containing protein [Candidatus Tectomicrobia bacterium]